MKSVLGYILFFLSPYLVFSIYFLLYEWDWIPGTDILKHKNEKQNDK
ncbi:hypothetical protein [Elizabethkingia anophelis]|nr:hypothetical protein [Elizabethkingia anophelis]EJC8061034.1 hypothetical protein [Elizabethkingia anophelis]MCL1640979.1 hypothetical protein [Elizabethkingia anophelis]MCL1646780.1 hypothetical protein [Elizabethkingia anophelis]WBS71386.1 hypothetical protein PF435_00715 [Elizabethkingia anophelis]